MEEKLYITHALVFIAGAIACLLYQNYENQAKREDISVGSLIAKDSLKLVIGGVVLLLMLKIMIAVVSIK